jgi:hypothetical protein
MQKKNEAVIKCTVYHQIEMTPPGFQLLPDIVVQLFHTLSLTYKTLPAKFRNRKC